MRAWCDEKGILLILDEVQTGIGRIGTLFGYEQFGIEPDIITLAKGLGGGIPIGAFLAKEKASVFAPGEHGSTFGGNPLACAAGYATLKFIIENDIPSKVKKNGAYLIAQLNKLKTKYDFIVEVRGRGLLAAIQFNSDLTDKNSEVLSGARASAQSGEAERYSLHAAADHHQERYRRSDRHIG